MTMDEFLNQIEVEHLQAESLDEHIEVSLRVANAIIAQTLDTYDDSLFKSFLIDYQRKILEKLSGTNFNSN